LGYINLDLIDDRRNDPAAIFRPSAPEHAPFAQAVAVLGVSQNKDLNLLALDLDAEEIGDCLPYPVLHGFTADQRYLIAFFGEKGSLDPVLRPLAQEIGANMYLGAGELSDVLIRQMARDAAADPLERPLVVVAFCDFDPAGMQMPVSIAWKLMAHRVKDYPDLSFKVVPAALTLEQVLAERLPTTMVKKGDRRRDKWQEAFGPALFEAGLIEDPLTPAQVEIDALAALRSDDLTRIARAAVEPYYDATLPARTRERGATWAEDARTVIASQIDPGAFAAVKADAEDALERLKEALDDLKDCDGRLDDLTEDIDLPDPPEKPEPEDRSDLERPLADSDWDLVGVAEALRARKAYDDVDVNGMQDNDDDDG
jgi:hypothetical protein